MKKKVIKSMYAMLIAMLCCAQTIAQTVKPASPPTGFANKYATADDIKIHYVIDSKGEPLLLIHALDKTDLCRTC